IVPDENTEVNQLRAHELDWQFEASPEHYAALQTIPDIRILLVDQNEYEYFTFNLRHPPLDDIRVRRAITYALDRNKLVKNLTFGSAAPADQDHPPFMWAHYPGVTRYDFDLSKARA